MKTNLKPGNSSTDQSSKALGPILDALTEISVQFRHVLQISKDVVRNLEMSSQASGEDEVLELELKKHAILANLAGTEEAIDYMNQEISALHRIGANTIPSGGLRRKGMGLQSSKTQSQSVLQH
jgi:hypothetical protein